MEIVPLVRQLGRQSTRELPTRLSVARLNVLLVTQQGQQPTCGLLTLLPPLIGAPIT